MNKKPDIVERIELEQAELINVSIEIADHIEKCREGFKPISKDSF